MQDAEHLKLLVIFHYIMAGLAVLGGCFASIYVLVGAVFVAAPSSSAAGGSGMSPADAEVLRMMGWIWGIIGGVAVGIAVALAVCLFLCGRYLSERSHPTFVFVMACIQCAFMPFGTALGVFTIIVLQRPSVKALFGQGGSALGSVH